LNQSNQADKFNVLNKVIKNIVIHPTEQKYRSLKKSNAKLNTALFSNDTILTLMSIIGFEDINDNYV